MKYIFINLLVLGIAFFSCSNKQQKQLELDEDMLEASLSLATEAYEIDDIEAEVEFTKDTTGMNLNIRDLKAHLKLQENVLLPDEYWEYFRDKLTSSQYKYTAKDLLLTLPFIEQNLKQNGFKELSDEEFRNKILNIFDIDIKTAPSEDGIIRILPETAYNDLEVNDYFRQYKYYPGLDDFYIIKGKNYLVPMMHLSTFVGINEDGEIGIKQMPKHITAMNKWLLNDNKAMFRFLENYGYADDYSDVYEEPASSLGIIFIRYFYDKDPDLNEWMFEHSRFMHTHFFIQKRKKLYISEPLMKILEERTTTDSYRELDDLGFHVFKIIKGERCVYFTEEEKIAIYHRYAILEKKMRDAHMVIEDAPAGWGASTTALVRTNFKEFYKKALESATGEAKQAIEDLTEYN